MKPRLVITGPTSALLTVNDVRIQLGARDIAPGDIDMLVVGRICTEELADLPAYLRRCNRDKKLEVFTPSVKDLQGMLAADEVCCTYVNKAPLQVALDSWCSLIEPAPGETLVSAAGVLVKLLPTSWMRAGDSLGVDIYIWDSSDDMLDAQVTGVLFADDNEISAAWVDEEDKKREAAAGPEGWKPVISRYKWAPMQVLATEDHHALFTQTRAPFDATAPASRKHVKGTIFTDDNVGREYRL